MLSTQTSNLPPGQHRRQNSTPTVFDSLKVPLLPATKPRHGSHGRSLSLDQPTNIQQQQTVSPQDDRTVSIKRHEQHHVRATQQHQQQLVRPGQNQQQKRQQPHNDQSFGDFQLEPYPEYGSGSPSFTHQRLPSSNDKNQPGLRKSDETDINSIKSIDSNMFAGYLDGFEYEAFDQVINIEFEGRAAMENASSYGNTPEEPTPRPDWEMLPRPCTPLSQSDSCYFPASPSTTSFSKTEKLQRAAGTRTAASSPTRRNPNLTIKAAHAMKRGSSCQYALHGSKLSPRTCKLPSPPDSARQSRSKSGPFPPLELSDLSTIQTNMDVSSYSIDYASSQCSPNALPSARSSFQSSPEMKNLSLFSDSNDDLVGPSKPEPPFTWGVSTTNLNNAAATPTEGSHSKTQSESECDRDTSIEDIGITSEEIAAFMDGPNPDTRWACTFPGCNRTFGRKENIKSHIQNHLGDRQFICSVCGNDFVRQHDLKRHMKIHSGVKPYTCPCGRTFCRQDALTRHRQRNTCEGGFDGLLRSTTKRGRPKKIRPDGDKRLAKSAKTRQRALEKAYEKAYQSSASSSSVCSLSSPPHMPNEVEIQETSRFDNAESLHANLREFLSSTPPTSPGYSTGNSFSSHNSQLSSTAKGVSMSPSPKIMSIPEEPQNMLLSHAMSRESSTSYYGTPPELDISCSSPQVPGFLGFDGEMKVASSAPPTSSFPQTRNDIDLLISNHDIDQMFTDTLGGGSPDKDPVFLLQNFENPFSSSSPWQDGFEETADNFFDNL